MDELRNHRGESADRPLRSTSLPILIGALANLAGFLAHTWPYRRGRVLYDKRFSRNEFGLVVASEPSHFNELKAIMAETGAEEVHVNG